MSRIFVSYSRQDVEFARQFAISLSNGGAKIWLDINNIPPGMNWSNAIQNGLDECQLMIVIITPEAMASANVENEWQYFLDEGRQIIPILLKPAKLHFQLRRLQYIDFYNLSYQVAFEYLEIELKKMGFLLSIYP